MRRFRGKLSKGALSMIGRSRSYKTGFIAAPPPYASSGSSSSPKMETT